jgi:hypothetical protein
MGQSPSDSLFELLDHTRHLGRTFSLCHQAEPQHLFEFIERPPSRINYHNIGSQAAQGTLTIRNAINLGRPDACDLVRHATSWAGIAAEDHGPITLATTQTTRHTLDPAARIATASRKLKESQALATQLLHGEP